MNIVYTISQRDLQ